MLGRGLRTNAAGPTGSSLTKLVIDADVATGSVFLAGLAPNTTYYYRFVARTTFTPGSGEVAEVHGVDGKVGEDGAEGHFSTYPAPTESSNECLNQAFRIGAGAKLPDCRAYEMVSPVDKNGADVSTGRATFGLSSMDGNRATFSSAAAFADPKGSPFSSQYIAERSDGVGWASRSISPPRTQSSSLRLCGQWASLQGV